MQNSEDLKIVFFPIKILLGFLIFSEILYFLGPIDYGVKSNIYLFFFLIIVNYSLYRGFRRGAVKHLTRKSVQQFFSIRALHGILLFALAIYILKYVLQMQIYSPSTFIQKVLFAVQNSGDVYNEKFDSDAPTIITYFFMLLSPITLLSQTLGIYYWKRLNTKYKLIVTIILFLEICSWLASGTRKGIFDVLVIALTMLILLEPKIVLDKKKIRKLCMYFVSGALLFIGYFVISNLSRYGISAGDFTDYDIGTIRPFYQDNFPFVLNLALSNITGYLCQGYRALSLALNDFINEGTICFTGGLGSSWFNINVTENLLGIDPLPYTYQGYLAAHYGIDEFANWHTIYLWLANDFTFIGVPFVVYWLGYLFSCTWIDALYHTNKYAAPMTALCVLIIIYAFANNQVLSFNFVPFFVLIVLYSQYGNIRKINNKSVKYEGIENRS